MGFIRNYKNQKVKNAVKVVDGLRNGPSRVNRASNDINDNLTEENIDALEVERVLGKIEERIKNEPIPTTHFTTQVIDVASQGNDVMGQYTKLVNNDDDEENKFNIETSTIAKNFYDRTHCNSNYETYVNCKDYTSEFTVRGDEEMVCDVKGSVVEDFKRGLDLTENLTVGQNFLENTDITGNRSIYWKTGGKMIREHTISGDRDILCDVKGSVVEDFKRGLDLTENLTVGNDYVRNEKIDANKTVNNTINGSVNNKTIIRETETSFKRVNGSQTIKVVVDEYDQVLVIRNGKNKNGPKKGYYKYKNVKIGDEELLVLCRCNAECKKKKK